MQPFKNILIPVDFSAYSERALAVGADLCRRYEARATVLHVCEAELFALPESYQLYDTTQLAGYREQLLARLEVARHQLLAAGVLQVDTACVQGGPAAEIIRFASEHAIDAIVMGTHGRTGLSHLLLGSVAEQVVRRARCTVITAQVEEGPTAGAGPRPPERTLT